MTIRVQTGPGAAAFVGLFSMLSSLLSWSFSLIFSALLAKRFGVRPPGWQEATAPFSDDQPRSVADIDSPESLARVRQWKKAMKAAGRAKSDPAGIG